MRRLARHAPSRSEFIRKLGEACGYDVVPRIGRSLRTPFIGPTHEGGLIAAGLGGVEIEVMAGDHATFAGVELKELGAGPVSFRHDSQEITASQETPFFLEVSMTMRELSSVKETHMNFLRSRASPSGKSSQHLRLWIVSHHSVWRSSSVSASRPLSART